MIADYFFVFGCIDLLILTALDLKKGKIESRYNWFMMGITASVIAVHQSDLKYVALIISISILLNIFLGRSIKKTGFMAKGDTESLSWIILGLGLFGSSYIIIFLMFFLAFSVFVFLYKKAIKMNYKTPGLPLIFGCFLITSYVFFCVSFP